MRGQVTALEEEFAEIFLSDRGVQSRAHRRLLKPLAEKFSHQPQHSFRFLVVFGAAAGAGGGSGQLPELSEDSRSTLMKIVEDLNDEAEKVTAKVDICAQDTVHGAEASFILKNQMSGCLALSALC